MQKYYSAIVVSNADYKNNGRLHVYIPKLMPSFSEETHFDTDKTFSSEPINEIIDNPSINENSEYALKNTIIVNPFLMNSNPVDGSHLVPDNESIVSVFFLDDDYSQGYYIFTGSPYIEDGSYNLDYADLLESKNFNHLNPYKIVNQKVLLRTHNDSIIGFDINEDTNSFIVKVNDAHKIKVDNNSDTSEIFLETENGNHLLIDNILDRIEHKTANDHFLIMDDTEELCKIKTTTGHEILMDDANELVEIKSTGGHKVLLSDSGSKLEVQSTSGHTILMDDSSGQITVTSSTGGVIVMGQGNINLN